MAECRRYTCNCCSKAILAWSDGNPYYLDEAGGKCYATILTMSALPRALAMIFRTCALIAASQQWLTRGAR